ncbi:MAG: 3-dehydroquinate synthase [Candidatus Symbiobacter sp.]|nr:3-dehydroquinate synthase [Candidatus Symbiobacter sp.]
MNLSESHPAQKLTGQIHSEILVELGERSYPIVIGSQILADAGVFLRHQGKIDAKRRLFIISDENVATHHGDTLQKSLNQAGFRHEILILPPGEASKSFDQLENIVTWLLGHKIDRQSVVMGLGGGVIGDLAGFAAAITLRGLDFVQIPTSLLAMVDSAVGGKTGINTAQGKNLVGAFHQPLLVLADMAVLFSLPPRELRAGYAEMFKHALIDGGTELPWFEENGCKFLTGNWCGNDDQFNLLAAGISHSCQTKGKIVGQDEREKLGGRRALLNLGHSFAHAIEGFCHYDGRVLHGEAVAIGLVMAARLSADLGHCPRELGTRIEKHLRAVGLPTRLADVKNVTFAVDALMTIMQNDKKMTDGKLGFVVIEGKDTLPLRVFQDHLVPPDLVRQILHDSL